MQVDFYAEGRWCFRNDNPVLIPNPVPKAHGDFGLDHATYQPFSASPASWANLLMTSLTVEMVAP